MTRKSVSGGWKAVVLILLFLSELILCAGILGNLEGVCNFLTAHGIKTVVTFLHGSVFFLIEIGAAVLLIVDTMIASITKVNRQFPSLMTALAFVYNDLAVIATVFGLYLFGQPHGWFPYPLAFLIPAITFLLTLICLIDDMVRDKGVVEEIPDVTKMAAESAGQPRATASPQTTVMPETIRPSESFEPEYTRKIPKPEAQVEPAFFVTPAEEPTWEAPRPEPAFVPATESVYTPSRKSLDSETRLDKLLSTDDVTSDAISDVDDLFFAFSDSDYVEDDLSE